MKQALRLFLLVLACASIAAALKMAVPRASPLVGWPMWAQVSLRNKLGLLLALPVYELVYCGWGYLVGIIGLSLMRPLWRHARQGYQRALGLGALLGTVLYLLPRFMQYWNEATLYAIHANGAGTKPWFTWIEWSRDGALLSIYAFTGLVGAALYYRWERARMYPPLGSNVHQL
ncbi:MAG: hypothetical protein EOO60_05730 [Hymenobacter sp.]|nr:MAG: hypothetical protein EOO60_05730 [Hymenobacter sp.]